MFKKIVLTLMVLVVSASLSWAGGWDKKKGLDQTTLSGELVVGCSLKKLDEANACKQSRLRSVFKRLKIFASSYREYVRYHFPD